MLEEQLIKEFRHRLIADAEAQIDDVIGPAGMALDIALAEVMLGDLEEAGALAEHELCPHEDADRRRCRVIAYSLPDDATRLELITSRFVPAGGPVSLPSDELSKLAGHAARFFEYVAKGDLKRFSENTPALEAAEHIRAQLSRIDEVRISILTNALVRDRDIDQLTIEERSVEFSVWDLARLFRASGEQVTRERIEVDFAKMSGGPIPVLEMTPPQSEYQTFLLILPGDLLSKLYDEFGPRLFEFNVRSFLQARGQVNKGIRDTLKSKPERFLAYNNGLTATADAIDVGTLRGQTVIHRLTGLQIVNGAQTTASIHRAHKVDKIDVSKVAVAMKLTRVEPAKLSEFVPLISKFANTQNPVQLADLSANNEFHIQMERLSNQIWAPGEQTRWFYERARGAYEVARSREGSTPVRRSAFDTATPKTKRFDKTDLAKVWMTWWEKPQVVSRGSQKNFAAFMADIRDRNPVGWQPDHEYFATTAALVMLYKSCKTAVRRAGTPSYAANVVTYLMAKLKADYGEQLDMDEIWTAQSISEPLLELLLKRAPLVHAEIIDAAGARNVTEFAKKDECWERVKAMRWPKLTSRLPEFGAPARTPITRQIPEASDPDEHLKERCTQYDGAAWAKIFAWAAGSPAVTPFDRQVVHTILGYAVRDWSNSPSSKQAQIAVRVLDAAARAKII